MGLGKFLLKYTPGSVGHSAKAMTKDFLKWKRERPNASKRELLELVLTTRMTTHSLIGKQFIEPATKEAILDKCQESLFSLIVCIDLLENPRTQEAYRDSPEVRQNSLAVIRETIEKHAPGVE